MKMQCINDNLIKDQALTDWALLVEMLIIQLYPMAEKGKQYVQYYI